MFHKIQNTHFICNSYFPGTPKHTACHPSTHTHTPSIFWTHELCSEPWRYKAWIAAATSFALFHTAVLPLTHNWASQKPLLIKYYQQNIFHYSETMIARNLYDRMILQLLQNTIFIHMTIAFSYLLPINRLNTGQRTQGWEVCYEA